MEKFVLIMLIWKKTFYYYKQLYYENDLYREKKLVELQSGIMQSKYERKREKEYLEKHAKPDILAVVRKIMATKKAEKEQNQKQREKMLKALDRQEQDEQQFKEEKTAAMGLDKSK